jgi:hypothetical protein
MHAKQPAVHVHMGATTFKPNPTTVLTLWEGAFHGQNLKHLCEHGPSQPTIEEKKTATTHLSPKFVHKNTDFNLLRPTLQLTEKKKGPYMRPLAPTCNSE